jgi:exopolyphosphatase / guanosine-5'-triphosphate,3'-diphosphate pyrophosphatase
LLVDIGGGSVELTVADSKRIHFCTSQKLGFLRLQNRFVSNDPIGERNKKMLQEHIDDTLADSLSVIRKLQPELFIATSGTATTLLRIVQKRQSGSEKKDLVTMDQLSSVLKTVLKSDLTERASELDLDVSRAMYFPAALLCMASILQGTGAEQFAVSPHSLREGLVYDFIEKSKPELRRKSDEPGDLGSHAVLKLALRCGYPEEHSHQVARIADQIFQQTRDLHGFGENEARTLRHASLLHDIGYHISYNKHHKHGAYLVMNGELSGFTPEEKETLAHLVRYHRGSKPKPSHESFAALPKKLQQLIKHLSAILRIADSLDRSHAQLAEKIECSRDGSTIEFRVLFNSFAPDIYLDLYSAKQRSRYFEKLFGIETRFVNLGVQPAKTKPRAAALVSARNIAS